MCKLNDAQLIKTKLPNIWLGPKHAELMFQKSANLDWLIYAHHDHSETREGKVSAESGLEQTR